ncbi:ABC transporter ATP-binding protein [uncultured Ferrimonas sp.]|uniref:ABC transporter ATP-binding protein n=1 Tax=uncultured Ferrimonas sp. TaxID=432640 RepID=UPI002634BC82|nr:ABC transporter ATP-binding protein [uncultured Ferrimonas sp.]
MNANPIIELQQITKSYRIGTDRYLALKGIDLRINSNEFIAITGPSGSGKSTLMNILGCLSQPDSGHYRLGDNDVASASEDDLAGYRNRSIGFIFQSFNLFAQLTVLDNVIYPLKFRWGQTQAQRKAKALQVLASVGLSDKINNLPNQLSGGQRQRVAIARALVTEPEILLGDEPTGNLDSNTTDEIMALFRQLHANGQTIVLVTHEPEIAAQCQRELRLVDGQIVQDRRREGAQFAPVSPAFRAKAQQEIAC